MNGSNRLRIVVACILGVLGLVILTESFLLVIVSDHAPVDLSSARFLITAIIGALLIVAGVLTVDWSAVRTGRGPAPTTDTATARHERHEPETPA